MKRKRFAVLLAAVMSVQAVTPTWAVQASLTHEGQPEQTDNSAQAVDGGEECLASQGSDAFSSQQMGIDGEGKEGDSSQAQEDLQGQWEEKALGQVQEALQEKTEEETLEAEQKGADHTTGELQIQKKPSIPVQSQYFGEGLLEAISEQADVDFDGALSQEEVEGVTKLDLSHLDELDLKGLEYFTNLSEADLSDSNIISGSLDENQNLTVLNLANLTVDQVSALGLEALTGLQKLDFSGVATEEEEVTLDLSANKRLRELDCAGSQIRQLKLPASAELESLDCSNNDLEQLSLKGLTGLRVLYCENNGLERLDLSPCSGLENLNASDNHLKFVDLSQNGSLKEYVMDHNTGYGAVDGENIQRDRIVSVTNGDVSGENGNVSIDFKDPTQPMTYTYRYSSVYDAVFTLLPQQEISLSEENFPDVQFRAYLENFATADGDGKILRAESVKSVEIDYKEYPVHDFTGIQYLWNLQSFYLVGIDQTERQAVTLDLGQNRNLQELYLSKVDLENPSLDLENNLKLRQIYVGDGNLRDIRLEANGYLRILQLEYTDLARLAVDSQRLRELSLQGNKLTELDISGCPRLEKATIHEPRLGIVDLGAMEDLIWLRLSGEKIREITWPENSGIQNLALEGTNTLKQVKITDFQNLKSLSLKNGGVEELRVERCPMLRTLTVESEKLKTLQMQDLDRLARLVAPFNELTSVQLKNCYRLELLDVTFNYIEKKSQMQIENCPLLDEDAMEGVGVFYSPMREYTAAVGEDYTISAKMLGGLRQYEGKELYGVDGCHFNQDFSGLVVDAFEGQEKDVTFSYRSNGESSSGRAVVHVKRDPGENAKLGTVELGSVQPAAYDKLKLTWKPLDYAQRYAVYRKNSGNRWEKIADLSKDSLSYVDTELKTGNSYTYTVRAYRVNSDGVKKIGGYDKTGVTGRVTPLRPQLGSVVSVAYDQLKVTWKKTGGATGYRVYRKVRGGNFSRIKTVDANTTSYVDNTAKTGTEYVYTVRAERMVGGTPVLSSYYAGISGAAKLSVPSLKSAVSADYDKIKISWNAVPGASGYRVYRKAGSDWVNLKTVSAKTTSYTNLKYIKTGTVYTYTVRAYRRVDGQVVWGDYSEKGITGKAALATPELESTYAEAGGLNIDWRPVSGAEGYLVFRKTGKEGWKTVKRLNGTEQLHYVDKTVKRNVTYYYTVRAFRFEDGKSVLSGYVKDGLKAILR